MIMQMVSKLKYKILTGSKLSSFTSTYTSWTFFTVDKLMDRVYHLHHVNLLHKEKITFTWPLAVKTKILIYNRSKFPMGMGKDSLSELVCGSNTAHKAVCLGIKSAGGTICVCWLCRSPLAFARAPALDRQERAPRPGLTGQEQSEQQLCQVLCRVTGLWPLWTWTRDGRHRCAGVAPGRPRGPQPHGCTQTQGPLLTTRRAFGFYPVL